MKNDEKRRKDIALFGDVLSVEDIAEYMGITKADAKRIINDSRLRKLSVPIRKKLVSKQDFLEYLHYINIGTNATKDWWVKLLELSHKSRQ